MVPRIAAGTVTVHLDPTGAGCEVEVTFELTALTPEGDQYLHALDDGPAAAIARWREPVTAYLHRSGAGH